MEELKKLLGEELYNQLVAKLGDKKIDIVNDGRWIPKEKFDQVNGQVKDFKQQVTVTVRAFLYNIVDNGK